LKPIVNLIWIKEVRGLENVPKTNFILASNHQSHWDQVTNAYICVPRRFTYLGQIDKYTGFERFLRDLLYTLAGVIPIHRQDSGSKQKAMEECKKRLKKGEILIFYPEGTRSKDGKIGEGKLGIAKLHLESGVPILPVANKGNFEIMPVGTRFPKFKKIIRMNIGKLLDFSAEREKAQNLSKTSQEYNKICQQITEKVMAEIKKLFDQL